jgi:hypothetical protein
MSLNGMPLTRRPEQSKRIACNVSQQGLGAASERQPRIL